MALGLTQPLTEMCTRNISQRVKAASGYGWQPYQLHVLIVLKSVDLNLPEPSGPLQACSGIALPIFKEKPCKTFMFCFLMFLAHLLLSCNNHFPTSIQ